MEERISRKKFIRLGAAIGVSVAGASVVAGCGGGGSDSGGSASTSSSGSGATSGGTTEMASGGAIAQASEVPKNSAKKFTDSGNPAVLVHLESGDFVAYSAVCTHQQCTVAYQKQSSQLACPCHGSIFDPSKNAQVVSGPAPSPLPEIPIKVQGGEITKA